MPTIYEAHSFAALAHAGQLDKRGQPYIRHLERVANRALARAGHARSVDRLDVDPQAVMQLALLHDVLEDTSREAADLRAAGFPEAVIAAVRVLTKPAVPIPYPERIDGVIASRDLMAILVKMSDNEDNLAPDRELPEAGFLRERYAASFARLREAAGALGYTGP